SLGLLFFFSSRRRHTRFSRDWSSDVCSSDLGACIARQAGLWSLPKAMNAFPSGPTQTLQLFGSPMTGQIARPKPLIWKPGLHAEIGRASCRDRVQVRVVAGS